MNDIEKDSLHIIAIVRALKNTQRFLGPLSAEEFADNDENRMPSHGNRQSRGARQEAVERVSRIGIRRSMAWGREQLTIVFVLLYFCMTYLKSCV